MLPLKQTQILSLINEPAAALNKNGMANFIRWSCRNNILAWRTDNRHRHVIITNPTLYRNTYSHQTLESFLRFFLRSFPSFE